MGQEHSGALHANSIAAGWTEARIERMTKLWVDGWSAAQIARELRVTRNSVIGMVHRRGLFREVAARPMRAPPVKRAPNQNAGLAFRVGKPRPDNLLAVNAERKATADDPGLHLPPSAPLPGSIPRPWPERTLSECAWPVGDGGGAELHHCCNKVYARGWCEVHFVRGTQTAKPPKFQADAPRRRAA